MSSRVVVQRRTEYFPAPYVPVTNVHAEAAWTDARKTDAQLQLASKNEQFKLHLYCNSGSNAFETIVDSIAANAQNKLYDVNLAMKPPENIATGWSRDIAAEMLLSDKTKFSFVEGTVNGYGTIDAVFYAYKDEAKMDGVVVNLHMTLITDTSFRIPKEAFNSRQ